MKYRENREYEENQNSHKVGDNIKWANIHVIEVTEKKIGRELDKILKDNGQIFP